VRRAALTLPPRRLLSGFTRARAAGAARIYAGGRPRLRRRRTGFTPPRRRRRPAAGGH